MQFAVHISDTPETLNQGHQTWYELVDTTQGYNHAKLKDFPQTASVKQPTLKFLSNQKTPLNMCKSEQ